MLELIKQPWHWSIAGILIGLTVPTLLLLGNKKFGISANLRHICAMSFPSDIPFFNYNWKKESWNILFVIGIFIGGFIATFFLENKNPIEISKHTQEVLASYGIFDYTEIQPKELFNWSVFFSFKGFFIFIVGGFLVGFGTRYAGGCTSGHAIMGISSLQIPSLIATCCFMIGGFFSTHFLIPLIFKYL